MTNTKIPGVSFSLKRALGITKLKRQFTKSTGIPTTKSGIERMSVFAKFNGLQINCPTQQTD